MSLTLESVLHRQPGAEDSSLNGDVVVLDAGGRMVRALNPTAARVWQLLDGQRSVREICATLAAEFDAGADAVEADVVGFLNYLCRVQLAVGGVE